MKTINIKDAVIDEIIITKEDASVSYKLMTDDGNIVASKRLSFKISELPLVARTAVETVYAKALLAINTREQL